MKIVVKVGTSTLAHATGRLNIRHVEELVKVLSDLKNAGHCPAGPLTCPASRRPPPWDSAS